MTEENSRQVRSNFDLPDSEEKHLFTADFSLILSREEMISGSIPEDKLTLYINLFVISACVQRERKREDHHRFNLLFILLFCYLFG